MITDDHKQGKARLSSLVPLLSRLPWLEILVDLWRTGRKLLHGVTARGMYEVIDYESTLELKDRDGRRATFKKRENVRYLQDNVIAYHDQAWGDGRILVGYRCTPGTAVDRYRSGYKTYILISRREVKNRGDVDEFNVRWGIREGFLRRTEQWETHVTHPTKRLTIKVIFPRSRPPTRTSLIQSNRQRTRPLGDDAQVLLPDGRWAVSWETRRPRLHETYILQWEW